MPGLIGTGIDYQKNALAGFVRESAEQRKIDETNKAMEEQSKQQTTQMAGQFGGLALMFLFAKLIAAPATGGASLAAPV